jgi:CTD small phosphatase-like protein 2
VADESAQAIAPLTHAEAEAVDDKILSPHPQPNEKIHTKIEVKRTWGQTIFSPVFKLWPFRGPEEAGAPEREPTGPAPGPAEEQGEREERDHPEEEVISSDESSPRHTRLSSDEVLTESSQEEAVADSDGGVESSSTAVVRYAAASAAAAAGTAEAGTVTTTVEQTYTEERDEEIFNPFLFIRNLPPSEFESGKVVSVLPVKTQETPRFTLVLDLDETLVHCSTETLPNADYEFPVVFNGTEYTVFARRRPHLETFIRQVASMFELVIFTASQKVYASKLLSILDPNELIKYRLYRDACCLVDGNYLKDLRILGRDLSEVIIIDNSPQAFGYQIDNGIPIESWFDDPNDCELLDLLPFLSELTKARDVRPHIRERYKLFARVESGS